MQYKKAALLLMLLAVLLALTQRYSYSRTKDHLQKMYACCSHDETESRETDTETRKDHLEEPHLSTWFDPKKRPDVIATTGWLAPVLWEGTYNREVLEQYYQRLNVTIGLAVFATGNFTKEPLRRFIKSADEYFMAGYSVIFYILADSTYNLPYFELGPLRTLKTWRLFEEEMCQDCNLRNMINMHSKIIHYIQYEVNFLFMMAVNQTFKNNFGVETLGKSVAQLHAWWYFKKPRDFPYERRTKAAAFIPFEEGDFYYHRAIVGGTPLDVLNLIEQYIKGIKEDSTNKLVSTFESHLNKYFFINKPARVLSPEYNWDPRFKTPPEIKHIKIAWKP